ncbi:MAG: isopenicillin N synthase family oxygenase [Alphaproteobacteria bacterium]|nr:isopenicillin N synthase family oxygenase [Alphaproteobacteria bacterium]
MDESAIPVIDLAPFIAGSAAARRSVAAAVDRACRETGVFTIVGHGVPETLIAETRWAMLGFFARPLAEKFAIARPSEEVSRGYNRLADQALSYSMGQAALPDLQESFAIGPADPRPPASYAGFGADHLYAPNLWPAGSAALQTRLEAYYRAVRGLAGSLMELLATALDLPADHFAGAIDRDFSILRVIHYPPQPEPPAPGQLRAGAHTDYGTVTILRGDDTPGDLQVKRRDGGWIDVHPEPGSFVVNLGDLMMRWTNDRWISTLHRVANPPRDHAQVPRLSTVFFHNPNFDAEIRCLETCRGRGARHAPIRMLDHFMAKHMKARYMRTDDAAEIKT